MDAHRKLFIIIAPYRDTYCMKCHSLQALKPLTFLTFTELKTFIRPKLVGVNDFWND